ncbi:MAG: glutathione S-transferase family protein [Pseudomonadota bacterium]
MKLYSGPISMFGAKAEVALAEKGLPFVLELVPYVDGTGYEPRHPEVLRVNPHKRQVPVLLDGDVQLYDSTQIFEYLEHAYPEPPLWPARPADRAHARLLEHESDEVFFAQVIQRMKPRPDDAAHQLARAARERIAAYHEAAEMRMADGRAWQAGGFSYADIAFFLAQLFAAQLGTPVPPDCTRLLDWQRRMQARPAVQPVAGRIADYFAARNAASGRSPRSPSSQPITGR